MKLDILLFILCVSGSAAAHGWLGSIAIAGKVYPANPPGTSGAASVIRQVSTNSPVTSVTSSDLTCGPDALPAQDVATANPGDRIGLHWISDSSSGLWFHDHGPMLTYLASCGNGPCSAFNASQASWFKIEETGRDADGKWVQARINSTASTTANITLPSTLAAGQYLLRHEIIALQKGEEQGGAEFYPSCSQIDVGGSGSGVPSSSDLVKLPGAYSATDPGILVDVYSNTNAVYTFPGPPVAAFVSGGASSPVTPTSNSAGATPASVPDGASSPATSLLINTFPYFIPLVGVLWYGI
ncbi:glycosyl hydrolase family 61-domain-containing protein [Mycena rebaudengoi]|nr:glycosyl hydrolase family 61-domain-containing protein [Mycena rebaudengoi]